MADKYKDYLNTDGTFAGMVKSVHNELMSSLSQAGSQVGAGLQVAGEAQKLPEIPSIDTSSVGTAPAWGAAKSVGGKALTTLGVGGAALVDTGTKAVNYLTGLPPTNLLPSNVEAFSKAWGMENKPPVGGVAPPASTASSFLPAGPSHKVGGLVPPAVTPDTTGAVPSATAQSLLQPGEKISGQMRKGIGTTPIGEVPTAVSSQGKGKFTLRGLGLEARPGEVANQRPESTTPTDAYGNYIPQYETTTRYVPAGGPRAPGAKTSMDSFQDMVPIQEMRKIDNSAFGLIEKSIRDIQASPGRERTKNRQVATLRAKQAGLVAGLEGRKITAEASKAGHEASAKDRDAIARERLQEFIRGNKAQEAHNQATLKQLTESGQDTRELRKQMAADTVFQKDLTKAGEDSVMGFDGGKGLFELGFTGRHTERPEVQQAYLPFETRLKKALGGKVPTAQQKKMARDAWYKEKGWTP